mgnify:CR=1 FL=1
MEMTIDELAALRGWDRGTIAEWVWAGEMSCRCLATIERDGFAYTPSAFMRFDGSEEGWWGKHHPLHDFSRHLLNRIAHVTDEHGTPEEADEARRGHFERLHYICKAAVADSKGANEEAQAILTVLDVLRDRILGDEQRSQRRWHEADMPAGLTLHGFAKKYGMPLEDAAYAAPIALMPLNSEHHAFEQQLGDEPWLGSESELTIILTQLHDPATPASRHSHLRERVRAHSTSRADRGLPPSMSEVGIEQHFRQVMSR